MIAVLRKVAALLTDALALVLRAAILAYRYGLSPVLGPHCRYTPTCSAYADQAIRLHGPLRGTWLAARRVARCHPWGATGYDPVPVPAAPPLSRHNASN